MVTQCLKGQKARGGNPQYFGNVCLKYVFVFLYGLVDVNLTFDCRLNVKLGGINQILAPDRDMTFLNDDANPTLILGICSSLLLQLSVILICFPDTGADVAHPAPGTEGRPSFTALVGSVDSNARLVLILASPKTANNCSNKANMWLLTVPKHHGTGFNLQICWTHHLIASL